MATPASVPQHRLPRTLSVIETYGFGLTGPPGWISLVVPMHLALGVSALWVWLPAALVGVLINYQVKRLGRQMTDVVGGTPNYLVRLLKAKPMVARYAAFGYVLSWISVIPINAALLTDIIQSNLQPLGIACPVLLLRIGFVLLPFVVAFSGTRALSLLHFFFVVPAIGLLVLFGVQGLGWLVFAPDSPGLLPDRFPALSVTDWAKWFLFATYAAYSSETAASFVAESRQPLKALRFLNVVAWLGLFIFLADSWVVARLATNPALKDSTLLHLVAASQPFWGQAAPAIVTFLMASLCLLNSATAVSNCPRIFYQLAQDRLLANVFGVVSKRGVFAPALFLTLTIAFVLMVWGNIEQVIVLGNVGWFGAFILLHWAVWQQRTQPEVLFPRLTLGVLLGEVVILLVGGIAWGWQLFLLGLLAPLSLMLLDLGVQQWRFAPFRATWWQRRYQGRSQPLLKDSLLLQVGILILLLSSAVLVGWGMRSVLDHSVVTRGSRLIPVLLMVVVFLGIAIASWTSLQQEQVAEERVAELAKVNQVLKYSLDRLAQEADLNAFLGYVLSAIAQQLEAASGYIFLFDAFTDRLELQIRVNDGQVSQQPQPDEPALFGSPFSAQITPLFQSLCQSRAIASLSGNEFDGIAWPTTVTWLRQEGYTEAVCLALISGEHPVGMLALHFYSKVTLDPEETELIQALAQKATVAIQLTRLADEAKQAAVFDERNRMAREIHDTLAQVLGGVIVQLQAADYFFGSKLTIAYQHLINAQQLAQSGLAEARRTVWLLYQNDPRYSDLSTLLPKLVQQLTDHAAIQAHVTQSGSPYPVHTHVGMNLSRIVQEAVHNCLRHANAHSLHVALSYTPQYLQISVRDDGCGFDPQQSQQGFGLISMGQRADSIGSEFTIMSNSSGTQINIVLPMSRQDGSLE